MPDDSCRPIPLDLAALMAARQRIAPAISVTPLLHSEFLSAVTGTHAYLKLENLQRTGSFKLRGAFNRVARLLEEASPPTGVIAASAGNHAQGVAQAARLSGLSACVVMPRNAPLTKIESCRAMGAEMRLVGDTLEEAADEAIRIGQARGLAFLHPYDDWDVIAGQASCALEIIDALPDVDVVVVPLGGGGLISGVALALKLLRPRVRVVGVQCDAVAPWRHFLRDGSLEAVAASVNTIADGIKVKRPGMLTRQVISRHVDEIVTVDDNAIAEAIVVLLERTRTIGEGAGVVALAALLQGRLGLEAGSRVVGIISGGNVDMTLVGRSIDYGLASSGRLMNVSVTVPDAPGRLVQLLKLVAGLGINVRHVEHRRGELHVPVGMTEVILQMETRDFEHQRELLERLAADGLSVRNMMWS